MRILTVTQVVGHLRGVVARDRALRDLWVEGEVSNCMQHSSGHWYWTLKDEGSALQCVLFQKQAAFQTSFPQDGRRFLLHGSLSVYMARGQVQMVVDHCEPAGHGDLHREFERIKANLSEEGLFDPDRKRQVPRYPRRIGVVTSADGAAFQDICHVIERRWPVEVVLASTRVQGDAAPNQICAALRAIGEAGVDVVLLTRGGGSLEDLWAFNDEQVARAVVGCPVPVISGVGHETDTTIVDFVADVRTPTPSAAAEHATPDWTEETQRIDDRLVRLQSMIRAQIVRRRHHVAGIRQRLDRLSPTARLSDRRRRLDATTHRLERAVERLLRGGESRVSALSERLAGLSPQSTLQRGYAHVQDAAGGTVTRVADVAPGDALRITVSDGSFDGRVEGDAPRQGELW